MKISKVMLSCLVIVLFVSCSSHDSSNNVRTVSKERVIGVDNQVSIPLEAKSGTQVSGMVEIFSLKEGTVLLKMQAKNVTPGLHAIHIHEKPDCSSIDGSSAGGHWNPTQTKHGRWGSKGGYHKGDIGVFRADKNGDVDYTFKTTTQSWCMGCKDPTRDILGHSIILHENTDDFVTQTTGNAGGRIACGVIR